MASMQSLLDKDKERFLNEIRGVTDTEDLKKKIDAELSRILFLYNEAEESEAVKTAAYSIIQCLRAACSFVDSVREAKLYSVTALDRQEKKHTVPAKAWVFAGIGAGCAAGAVILLLLSVRAAQLIINLPLFAVLMAGALLFIFLFGMYLRAPAKEGNKNISAEILYDDEKIYRHLYSSILTADRMLDDIRSQELIERRHLAEKERNEVDQREISFLSQLIEDAYAQKSTEYGMETISNIKYYLHSRHIEAVDYSRQEQAWFDVLPGEGGTLRPALVMDGVLLKKGLVSGGRL